MQRRDFLKGFIAVTTVVTAKVALAPLSELVELPVKHATFEDLVAATLRNYRSILADNITSQNVIYMRLLNGNA